MKTKLKRALSAVLTCAMVLGFMPAIAGAASVESTIKVTDAATDAEITNAEITIKDSSGTNVTATDGKYTLDTDKTYTFSATATGYEAVDAKTFTPDASEQETFKMNPIFTITYYDNDGVELTDLGSSYLKTHTYGTVTKLSSTSPKTVSGYTFVGWALKDDTDKEILDSIAADVSDDVALQAVYTNKPSVKMAGSSHAKSESVTLDATSTKNQEVPIYGVITVTFPLEMSTSTSKAGTVTLTDSTGETIDLPEAKDWSWNSSKKVLTISVDKKIKLDTSETYTLTVKGFTTSADVEVDPISFSNLKAKSYTLTFENGKVDGSSTMTLPSGIYVDLDSSDYEPDTSSNVSFKGWYTDEELDNSASNFVLTKNRTLYAAYYYPDSSSNSESIGKVYPRLDKTRTGYISGYSDGTIKPKANMTREEVASMFYNMVNSSTISTYGTTENEFTDVSSDRWSNAAISTLANAGVLTGYSDGTFRPSATITRAEFITIITRLESASTAGQAEFSDIDGHWAKDAIMNAYSWGVVTGYSDNTFRPNQNVTRAEAVAMVNRLMGRSVSESSLTSGMKTFTDNQDTTAWYYLDIQVAAN